MNALQFAAAAGTLACVSAGFADIQLISQTRELSVRSDFSTVGGTDLHPQQSSSAPGFGPYSDTFSVTTPKSTAMAEMISTISTTSMTATGSCNATAAQPLVTEQTGAKALARYVVDFNVDAPTSINYHAAIPTAFPQPLGPATTQHVWIYFRDITRGEMVAHVIAAWGVTFPGPTIEPPVDLTQTLAAGHYQIEVVLEHAGAGLRPPSFGYSDHASFEVSLTVNTPCYPNCDSSSAAPMLNANDFQCFVNAFSAGASYANCDNSTAAPVLNANDFQCFLAAFAQGCS